LIEKLIIRKRMRINKINAKKGALELSIGTIVILVIAMTMLILGLTLVRSIFGGATDSVEELGSKVQNEITNLFVDDSKNVVVKLGSDKTARIKAGTNNFGVGIGARTNEGELVQNRNHLKYRLELDTGSNNCVSKLGKDDVSEMFSQNLEMEISFNEFDADTAFARILISIPEGTPVCSQTVFVDVIDTFKGVSVGGSSFSFEILKRGIF
jgi:hypothetical protein